MQIKILEMSVAELLKKKREVLANKNLEDGKLFCQEAAKKQGVHVTEEGIIYEILKEGRGELPLLNDRVEVHYHGTTIHGDVFDSSVDKGKAAIFTIDRLIKGYQIMLPKFQVGTKFKMVVPSDLAYKDQHINKLIGPNSTLVFEVELLNIIK
ncbi:FKBP-type peptidyl-prolyl cis-trans isomerase [Myroides pelagicus]